MKRHRSIVELTRVRLLNTYFREPESVFWVFVFPLMLVFLLSVAFGRKDDTVRVGIMEVVGVEALVKSLEQDQGLEVVRFESRHVAELKLRRGAIAALIAPASPVQIRFDPTRPESMGARLRIEAAIQAAAGRQDPVAIDRMEMTETGSRYIDFLLPGILGMNLMGTSLWAMAFSLVADRERRMLKRFLVTPMQRWQFLLAVAISRLLFMVLEVAILLGFAVGVLGVPMNGSCITVGVIALTGTLAFASLGLLLASRARTIGVISGLVGAAQMPMWLLSGVFFSYERFPEFTHAFIKLLPLAALVDALRDTVLKGAGLADNLPELGVLAVWAAVCFFLALKIFKWYLVAGRGDTRAA